MNKKIIKIQVLIICILTALFFAGCNAAQNQAPDQNQTPGQATRYGTNNGMNDDANMNNVGNNVQNNNIRDNVGGNNRGMPSPGNAIDRLNRQNGNNGLLNNGNVNNRNANSAKGRNNLQMSQDIAENLKTINGVENAIVVVSGNTALVGIDVADDFISDGDKDLKGEITKQVKNMQPDITNVAISESPDLFQRIQNLSRDISNGRPMQGLGNEFMEIVNRIVPDMR